MSLCLLATAIVPCLGSPLSFDSSTLISSGLGDPTLVQAVDLDGDGDLDLIAAEGQLGPVTWWENLGQGHYRRAGEWRHHGLSSIRIADFDGDGRVDLLAAEGRTDNLFHYSLWKGQGLAGFAAPGPELPFTTVASAYAALAFPDIDGDGRADVFAAGKIWLSQGDGSFLPAPGAPLPPEVMQDYRVADAWVDVNGDGLLDYVYQWGGFQVSLNRGAAGFSPAALLVSSDVIPTPLEVRAVSLPAVSPLACLLVTEVDPAGDRRISLVAKRDNGWEKVASLKIDASNDSIGLALAVTMDSGKPRIFLEQRGLGYHPGQSVVLHGRILEVSVKTARTGALSLTARTVTGLPDTAAALQFADLNGDGKNDALYVTSPNSSSSLEQYAAWGGLQWQAGAAGGRFTRAIHPVSQPMLSSTLDAAVDLDGDGDPDLLSHLQSLSSICLWTNSDHGASFTQTPIFTRGSVSRVLKVVETGAKAKLLVYCYTAPRKPVSGDGGYKNELVLLTRLPNGKFSQKTLATETGQRWIDASLEDGDGDGIPDLRVYTSFYGNSPYLRPSHWLPGLAALKFGRPVPADSGRFPGPDQLRVDVDWDGDMDLWEPHLNNYEHWVENTGTLPGIEHRGPTGQSYNGNLAFLGHVFPAGLDFDGDGHEDYVTDHAPVLARGSGPQEDPYYPLLLNFTTLQESFSVTGTREYIGPLSFRDVDGDGDLDYLAPGYDGILSYRENLGGVTYAPRQLVDPAHTANFDVSLVADIDGDGIPDIVSSAADSFRFQWFKGSRP